ncbi:MAG: FAD-dependent oxidoreductase [Ponticaulis sp.]|nr:FAD-dependent oxidoreductase [Ponticaulis sp.]|tara:strand:+ start:159323 stop:160531 length:1209 start_codon:yes stop_codon:yes gene_type:complete
MSSAPPLSIAIGGAGIGGLAAAILLARDGHKVTLYDRFDQPEPVGSGLMLQSTGLAVLNALGLSAQIEACSTRINRLFGRTQPSGRTVLDVRFAALKETLQARGIQRSALFNALFSLAQNEDISFEPRSEISNAAPDGGMFLFENGSNSPEFDLLIDALGARSPLSSHPTKELPFGALWATIPWPDEPGFLNDALEQRYRAARQMTGLMPSGAPDPATPPTATYFWSIEGHAYDAWKAGGLAAWQEDAIALWPETASIVERLSVDQLIFARYRHRTHAKPVTGRLFHLGDSWHATSPQLGQGANMALLDALALRNAIRVGGRDTGLTGRTYRALRVTHIRLYQAMSYLFTPVYQSHATTIPWLRDHLAAPLSRIWPAPPILAALVSGAFGSPLKKLGLTADH